MKMAGQSHYNCLVSLARAPPTGSSFRSEWSPIAEDHCDLQIDPPPD